MSVVPESNKQWFEEVIQPTIDMLNGFINGTHRSDDLDMNAFFKTFLIDLEMIELDTPTVETFVDKILDGLLTMQVKDFQLYETHLKPLALIAVSGTLDRAFYLDYWRLYRPLKQKHPEITDHGLINAFYLKSNMQGLVKYLMSAKTKESGN